MPPPKTQKKAEVFLHHFHFLYYIFKPLKPDESGIPKNDVSFKFEFEILQNNIQNIMICFEWFGQNSENIDRNETPLIENWQPKAPDSNDFFLFVVMFWRSSQYGQI